MYWCRRINLIYYIQPMKGDNVPKNRIVPIQSLVEASRQQSMRSSNQSAHKDHFHSHNQSLRTSTHSQNQNNEHQFPTHSQHEILERPNSGRPEKAKVATIKKSYASTNFLPDNQSNLALKIKISSGFEQHSYPKTERVHRIETAKGYSQKKSVLENYQIQPNNILTPKSIQKDAQELPFMKQRFKSIALTRGTHELDKYPSVASDLTLKLDEQTCYASRLDKTNNSSREAQPIFKSEIGKIKTQLFQKEACLFQLSQKLEEKDRVIKDLTEKLETTQKLVCSQKNEARNQNASQLESTKEAKMLQERIRQLEQQGQMYKKEIKMMKEAYEREQQRYETSKKLMVLKIRQLEIEDREKSQYILQLRQRQKRILENNDKIANGHQQLLRQKEEQLVKISHTAQLYRDELERALQQHQHHANNESQADNARQLVIHELSDEMTDVKKNLHELQMRMRQMIENEQETNKQLQRNSQIITHLTENNIALEARIQELQQRLGAKDEELANNKIIIDELTAQFNSLEDELSQKITQMQQLESVCQAKDFEISMMSKTCQDYRRKVYQYQQFSEQMRVQIQGYEKKEQSDKNAGLTPKKAMSPFKEGKGEDKEAQLKQTNLRLTKQVQRLNALIRSLNNSVYQFYKVNKGLNQTIVEQQLSILNQKYSLRQNPDY